MCWVHDVAFAEQIGGVCCLLSPDLRILAVTEWRKEENTILA
jgi:hypothetical protein